MSPIKWDTTATTAYNNTSIVCLYLMEPWENRIIFKTSEKEAHIYLYSTFPFYSGSFCVIHMIYSFMFFQDCPSLFQIYYI